jgi:hypothetical protein
LEKARVTALFLCPDVAPRIIDVALVLFTFVLISATERMLSYCGQKNPRKHRCVAGQRSSLRGELFDETVLAYPGIIFADVFAAAVTAYRF